MIYAVIDAGAVSNVISADAAFISTLRQENLTTEYVEVSQEMRVGIGHLWDGNVFTATAPPSPTVPLTVTMRQARLALLQSGHYTAVVDYINGMTGDAGIAARVTWEYSTTVERYMPLTIQLKGILGLTDLETDALYELATTL
jgi:hypothetical protein